MNDFICRCGHGKQYHTFNEGGDCRCWEPGCDCRGEWRFSDEYDRLHAELAAAQEQRDAAVELLRDTADFMDAQKQDVRKNTVPLITARAAKIRALLAAQEAPEPKDDLPEVLAQKRAAKVADGKTVNLHLRGNTATATMSGVGRDSLMDATAKMIDDPAAKWSLSVTAPISRQLS